MAEQAALPHGVMEGKGFYNRHAKLPAGGGALAIPVLEDAARKIAVAPVDQPLMIADYGSSQGKNSLAPMRAALGSLRARIGSDRAVFVFHIDQPSNDFNSLFEVMSDDPDRYAAGDGNVFPCAIGRSFYEQVLPAESVHLGWCSYAAVWLSCVPGLLPGHFLPVHTCPGRAAFTRQAAEDWEAFLALRARELRPGGRLVLVFPGRNDEGLVGFEHSIEHANAALGEMVDSGEIRAEERERMVVATYPRQKSELLAPFEGGREFRGLRVEHYELLSLPDAAWADYQRDGDSEALATKHALFFRAIFVPSLASSLDRVRAGDSGALHAFADQLQERLVRRLAAEPAPADSFVQTMAVAKAG